MYTQDGFEGTDGAGRYRLVAYITSGLAVYCRQQLDARQRGWRPCEAAGVLMPADVEQALCLALRIKYQA